MAESKSNLLGLPALIPHNPSLITLLTKLIFMSRRSNSEPHISLGWVLIIIGLLTILTVMLVWALSPIAIPERILLAQLPAHSPTITLPTPMPLPTTAVQTENRVSAGIFLPETPIQATLPSVAAADLAPRIIYLPPVPNQPSRLVIPVLGLDIPVVAVGLMTINTDTGSFQQWQVPNAPASGWHNTSAVLGQLGNTVFNGHHNIYGEVFRDLAQLEIGDTITLYTGETPYHYQVTQNELLPELWQTDETRLANAQWIGQTDDERITLVTCWPYTGNSHRLVIVAKPIP